MEKVKEKEKDLQNNNNECALVHLPVMLEQLLLLTGCLTFKHQRFLYIVSEEGIDSNEPLGLTVPTSLSEEAEFASMTDS